MEKIGILTYHYSNNYGGVLQSYALYKYLSKEGYNVEIIDFIPNNVKLNSIFYETGLRKNIFKIDFKDLNPITLFKRINIKRKYNKKIIEKFNNFRETYCKLSRSVNENTIHTILNDYNTIIVGSDQVWSPGERRKKIYFLDFDNYNGRKISYAADSTISEIDKKDIGTLSNSLRKFDAISVRNKHTSDFVMQLINNKEIPIVVDPTLLISFDEFKKSEISSIIDKEKYIFMYVLGKELEGDNEKVINKIKKIYGNLKVYSVEIPTRKFNVKNFADKVFYDLGPIEWIDLIRNASFVYTDSFHGTIFSLKFNKPFLAYYSEYLRSTRFRDLKMRYGLEKFIVNSYKEIEDKRSLYNLPDFKYVDRIIDEHRKYSIEFLKKALNSSITY